MLFQILYVDSHEEFEKRLKGQELENNCIHNFSIDILRRDDIMNI